MQVYPELINIQTRGEQLIKGAEQRGRCNQTGRRNRYGGVTLAGVDQPISKYQDCRPHGDHRSRKIEARDRTISSQWRPSCWLRLSCHGLCRLRDEWNECESTKGVFKPICERSFVPRRLLEANRAVPWWTACTDFMKVLPLNAALRFSRRAVPRGVVLLASKT